MHCTRYKFQGYWVPPTHGGKDLANNRMPHFANWDGKSGLYAQSGWSADTVSWCKDMSPASGGTSLSMSELIDYVSTQFRSLSCLRHACMYMYLMTCVCVCVYMHTMHACM